MKLKRPCFALADFEVMLVDVFEQYDLKNDRLSAIYYGLSEMRMKSPILFNGMI